MPDRDPAGRERPRARDEVELDHVEQLTVALVGRANLDQGELTDHAFPGREYHRRTDAHHLLEMLHGPVGRRCVRVNHDREPRESRRGSRPYSQTVHREVAPPDEPDRAVQRDPTIFQQHRHGARDRHVGTSGSAGSPSIGSDREPPGGIMGYTFSKDDTRTLSRYGPGSRTAVSSAEASSCGFSTVRPLKP